MPSSDPELARAARGGDPAAAAALFDRYWPAMWRLALAYTGRRDLADEAAQEGLVRALGAVGRFDDARSFGAWLRTIVVNAAVDAWRRERRHAHDTVVDDDAEARARARAAVLAVVGAAPAPSTQEPSRRRAQAAIAALAVATVAAGVVAIVARRGDAPDTARPPSPPATARVETLASLRGLLGAPRAPRLPGWLQPAYRDASGGDAPAGPARLLVTAAGPDREAIYAWPTRSGGLALAGGDALGTDRPAPVPAGALLGLGRRPPDAVRDRRAAGGHRPLVYGLVTDDVAAVAIRVSGGRSTGRHSRTMPSRTSCRTRRRQARPTPSG